MYCKTSTSEPLNRRSHATVQQNAAIFKLVGAFDHILPPWKCQHAISNGSRVIALRNRDTPTNRHCWKKYHLRYAIVVWVVKTAAGRQRWVLTYKHICPDCTIFIIFLGTVMSISAQCVEVQSIPVPSSIHSGSFTMIVAMRFKNLSIRDSINKMTNK